MEISDKNETIFRQFLNSSSDPISLKDGQLRYIFINRAYEQFLKIREEDVIGKTDEELLSEEQAESFRHSDEETLAGDAPIIREEQWGEKIFKVKKFRIDLPKGNFGIGAYFRDITERRKIRTDLMLQARELRLITDNIRETLWLMDRDFRITWASPSTVHNMGYSSEDLFNLSLQAILTPESFNTFQETTSILLTPERLADHQSDIIICLEMKFVRKDGSNFWSDAVISVLRDSKGKPKALLGVAHDITERKYAEYRLKQSETKFRRLSEEFQGLLDALPDSLMLIDKDYKILWANQVAVSGFKEKSNRVTGEDCFALAYGFTGPCPSCPVGETFETDKPAHRIITREDGTIWDFRTIPLFDGRGKTNKVIKIKRDITEHRKLEEQLFQSQKMEAVGAFAAGVAFDFNDLLTTMIGNAELGLQELPKDTPLREELEEIKEAGDIAAGLIRRLLAFSQKQEIHPESINLNEAIGETETMLRKILGEGIELISHPDPNLGTIMADPRQIDHVLINLITNARDAMPSGGKLTIETANVEWNEIDVERPVAVKAGSYVRLCISDTGIGIPPEVQARIFEPFFTTKEKSKGTGLGLSTVYGIVKQSGGTISVSGEPGQGTTFKIYLPRADQTGKLEPTKTTERKVSGYRTNGDQERRSEKSSAS